MRKVRAGEMPNVPGVIRVVALARLFRAPRDSIILCGWGSVAAQLRTLEDLASVAGFTSEAGDR